MVNELQNLNDALHILQIAREKAICVSELVWHKVYRAYRHIEAQRDEYYKQILSEN